MARINISRYASVTSGLTATAAVYPAATCRRQRREWAKRSSASHRVPKPRGLSGRQRDGCHQGAGEDRGGAAAEQQPRATRRTRHAQDTQAAAGTWRLAFPDHRHRSAPLPTSTQSPRRRTRTPHPARQRHLGTLKDGATRTEKARLGSMQARRSFTRLSGRSSRGRFAQARLDPAAHHLGHAGPRPAATGVTL